MVVAVIPSANRSGSSFLIHHSELCSLRPHQWLTGEVFDSLNVTHKISKNHIWSCCAYFIGVINLRFKKSKHLSIQLHSTFCRFKIVVWSAVYPVFSISGYGGSVPSLCQTAQPWKGHFPPRPLHSWCNTLWNIRQSQTAQPAKGNARFHFSISSRPQDADLPN